MLTNRGRITLFLAAGIYVAGWAFGTWEAYPLALGLAIAVAVAAVTVRIGRGPYRLTRRIGTAEAVEGSELPVRVEVRSESGAVPPTAELVEVVQGVRRVTVPLRRGSDGLYGHYTINGLPRGRYGLEPARLVVEDPFGLQRSESLLEGGQALTVHPRVYDLDRLFSDAGSLSGEGRRFLLSRASGYDLHGVRDYQQGESLRAVHWKSTAKRRKLMVKELEDDPREEAAVVLDARAGMDVGVAPDSSFEMQVRAAASVLRRLASSGQRSALLAVGARVERVPVASLEGDWRSALDLLAAVRPDGPHPLAAALEEGRSAVEAQRLYLVTADLSPRLADRLASLAVRHELAVVWVDARTWAGAAVPAGLPDGVAVNLRRIGVPVARVRRGDDLRAVLDARPTAAVATDGTPVVPGATREVVQA